MPSQSKQQLQLQRLMQNAGDNMLGVFEKFLQIKPEEPQHCNKNMMDSLASIIRKAIQNPRLSEVNLVSVRLCLQTIQHLACYERHAQGLHVLLDHGLIQLLSEVFITALHCVRESRGNPSDGIFGEILETLTCVGDYSPRGKTAVIETFCDRFLQVITSENFRFPPRMEALKTLNMLLERCPTAVREKLMASGFHNELVHKLGTLISYIGDYEFQVGIIEALFRLVSKASRPKLSKVWFPIERIQHGFLSIKDSDFETDCRDFLNDLNASCTARTRVFSIACSTIHIDNYELKKPEDEKYTQFWVDFNTGSKRISLFCNQEPSNTQEEEEDRMWETLSLWDQNVENFILSEGGPQMVGVLLLKASTKDLISFGPKEAIKKVTIRFWNDVQEDIKAAFETTFGAIKALSDDKFKVTGGKKASVAEYPVNLKLKEVEQPKILNTISEESPCEAPNLSASGKKSTRTQTKRHVEVPDGPSCSQNSEVASTPRLKVSVPCEPMRKPTLYAAMPPEKNAYPTQAKVTSVTEKELPPPKTPTRKRGDEPKRVKTPLHIISGADSTTLPPEPSPSQKQQRTNLETAKREAPIVTIERPLTQPSSKKKKREPSRKTRASEAAETICHSIEKNTEVLQPTYRSFYKPVMLMPEREIVPSSCPEEETDVIPDSQPVKGIPLPFLNTSHSVDTKLGDIVSSGSQSQSNDVIPESQFSSTETNSETLNTLKQELTEMDAKVYPKNMYKLSNTPALSTVTEESTPCMTTISATSTPKAPHMTAIPEQEEMDKIVTAVDHNTPTDCLVKTQKKRQPSPDSTSCDITLEKATGCQNSQTSRNKTRGKAKKKEDNKDVDEIKPNGRQTRARCRNQVSQESQPTEDSTTIDPPKNRSKHHLRSEKEVNHNLLPKKTTENAKKESHNENSPVKKSDREVEVKSSECRPLLKSTVEPNTKAGSQKLPKNDINLDLKGMSHVNGDRNGSGSDSSQVSQRSRIDVVLQGLPLVDTQSENEDDGDNLEPETNILMARTDSAIISEVEIRKAKPLQKSAVEPNKKTDSKKLPKNHITLDLKGISPVNGDRNGSGSDSSQGSQGSQIDVVLQGLPLVDARSENEDNGDNIEPEKNMLMARTDRAIISEVEIRKAKPLFKTNQPGNNSDSKRGTLINKAQLNDETSQSINKGRKAIVSPDASKEVKTAKHHDSDGINGMHQPQSHGKSQILPEAKSSRSLRARTAVLEDQMYKEISSDDSQDEYGLYYNQDDLDDTESIKKENVGKGKVKDNALTLEKKYCKIERVKKEQPVKADKEKKKSAPLEDCILPDNPKILSIQPVNSSSQMKKNEVCINKIAPSTEDSTRRFCKKVRADFGSQESLEEYDEIVPKDIPAAAVMHKNLSRREAMEAEKPKGVTKGRGGRKKAAPTLTKLIQKETEMRLNAKKNTALDREPKFFKSKAHRVVSVSQTSTVNIYEFDSENEKENLLSPLGSNDYDFSQEDCSPVSTKKTKKTILSKARSEYMKGKNQVSESKKTRRKYVKDEARVLQPQNKEPETSYESSPEGKQQQPEIKKQTKQDINDKTFLVQTKNKRSTQNWSSHEEESSESTTPEKQPVRQSRRTKKITKDISPAEHQQKPRNVKSEASISNESDNEDVTPHKEKRKSSTKERNVKLTVEDAPEITTRHNVNLESTPKQKQAHKTTEEIAEKPEALDEDATTAADMDAPEDEDQSVTSFAKMCQGLLETSTMRFEAEYKEKMLMTREENRIIQEETERYVDELLPEPKQPTTKIQSVQKKTQFDPYIMDNEEKSQKSKKKKKKNRHHNIFSDPDDSMSNVSSSRSEISWLGSTARKKKQEIPKVYHCNNNIGLGRPKLVDITNKCIQDAQEDYGSAEAITPKHKHAKKIQRRQVEESPELTESENEEDLYYEPRHSRSKASKVREKKKPTQAKGVTGMGQDAKKQPQTPQLNTGNHDMSIELARFEDSLQGTPYLVEDDSLQFPMSFASFDKIEGDDDCEVEDDEASDIIPSQISQATHISSICTPKTPRPSKSSRRKSQDSAKSSKRSFQMMFQQMDDDIESEDFTKSGPSKKRRVSGEVPDIGIPSAESDVSSSEEDIPSVSQQLHQETTLIPRRLFTPGYKEMKAVEVDDIENLSDVEGDEDEEDDIKETGTTICSSVTASLDHSGSTDIDMPVQSGLSALLNTFGIDMQKNLMAKKKQLDDITKFTLKSTQKHVTSHWKDDKKLRWDKLGKFRNSLLEELHAIEHDIEKEEVMEQKAYEFFENHLSSLRTGRSRHEKRLKKMQDIGECLLSDLAQQEESKTQKQSNLQEEMRHEMKNLQNKLLRQAHEEELKLVKRSLQTIFL